MLQCKNCGVELTVDNTYRRSGREANFPVGYYRKCKKCYNAGKAIRRKENKISIIKQLGGKCVSCGSDKCAGALELHHKDPATKEHAIVDITMLADTERIQREVDKCVLLCANCHRETHLGLHPEYLDH